MSLQLHHLSHHCHLPSLPKFHSLSRWTLKSGAAAGISPAASRNRRRQISLTKTVSRRRTVISASSSSLDLTEDNINQVLDDARAELGQLFDTSVGITGKVQLAEIDGPYVKIRLSGKFWHKRSTVLARLGNYLKQRIPEILEVDIEDEKQLDDSPENF